MLTFIKFNFPEIKCYRNFSFSLTSIKLHLTLKSNQNSPKLLQWGEKILKLRYNWFQFQNLPPSSQRSGWGWSAVCCPQSEYFSKEANFPAAINHILTRWSSNKNNTGLTTTTRPGDFKKDPFLIINIMILHKPKSKKIFWAAEGRETCSDGEIQPCQLSRRKEWRWDLFLKDFSSIKIYLVWIVKTKTNQNVSTIWFTLIYCQTGQYQKY